MIHRTTAVPQPFWHQGPVLWKTIFPWRGGGDGSVGNASDGERQMKLHSLTSCCAAPRGGWGVWLGTPAVQHEEESQYFIVTINGI